MGGSELALFRAMVCCAMSATLAGPVAADYPSALVLSTGYATGPAQWQPWQNLPNVEDSLWIFGSVARVDAPFDDLLPPGPHELTYVFESYACVFAAFAEDFVCSFAGLAIFDLGSLRVFLDTSPDADFADPATFRDGELVLVASAHPLQLFMEEHCVNGRRVVQRAVMRFAGGAWFHRVSREGDGFVGANLGEFDGDVPAGLRALGYVGRSSSRVDVVVPTSVTATTWGRIKALYR